MSTRKREINSSDAESQSFLNNASDDDRYGRKRRPRSRVAALCHTFSRLGRGVFYLIVIFTLVFLLSNTLSTKREDPYTDHMDPGFHIILFGAPNRTSPPNLCRSLLTTSALEYPRPIFVNSTVRMPRYIRHHWLNNSRDTEAVELVGVATAAPVASSIYPRTGDAALELLYNSARTGEHIEERDEPVNILPRPDFEDFVFEDQINQRHRFEAVQRILWQIQTPGSTDKDIVLVTDAYDSVLQLPVGVILERYHALNRAALQRGFKQTIVFAASKECALPNTSEPLCMIQSWLSQSQNKDYHRNSVDKTDYLYPGFFIGPVDDLLAMFDRAQHYRYVVKDARHSSHAVNFGYGYGYGYSQRRDEVEEATLYTQIYAEQQLFREIKRSRDVTWWNLASMRIASIFRPGASTKQAERLNYGLLPSHKYDFHIGLDYGSSLVHVSEPSSIDNVRFVKFGDTLTQKLQSSTTLGCKPPRLQLPRDLHEAVGPFSKLGRFSAAPQSLFRKRWADVELYTNLCAGSVPAVILYREDSTDEVANSARREDDWRSLWLHDYSQKFLEYQVWQADHATAEILSGSLVFGVSKDSNKGRSEWVDVLKGDVNVGNLRFGDGINATTWEDMCGSFKQDLF